MESYRMWSCVSGSLFVACFQGCSVVSHGSGLHFYCQMRFCLTQHLFKHTSVATPPQTDPIRVRGLGTEQVSLVAQLVKNPPAMRETWVRSLGRGRSPGEGKGYPLQYSGLESSMDCTVRGVTKSQPRLSDFHRTDYLRPGVRIPSVTPSKFQTVEKIKSCCL